MENEKIIKNFRQLRKGFEIAKEEFGENTTYTIKQIINMIDECLTYEKIQKPQDYKEPIDHTKFTKSQVLDIEKIAFEVVKNHCKKIRCEE